MRFGDFFVRFMGRVPTYKDKENDKFNETIQVVSFLAVQWQRK